VTQTKGGSARAEFARHDVERVVTDDRAAGVPKDAQVTRPHALERSGDC
jgi:hypothetical protein